MISVALTTYNGEKYIREQLESIVHQSVRVDEIIVCDDKSSDNTCSIIRQFIKDNPEAPIIFHINEKNLGYIGNFYQAIEMTSGDFIFLSDQDDIWMPNKVEAMICVMKDGKTEVLCTGFALIDEKGNEKSGKYNIPDFIVKAKPGISSISVHTLLYGNISQGCTYCFTKRVKQIYLAVKDYELIHDYQIILIGAFMDSAYFLNEKLIRYRIHGSNSVGFKKEKNLKHINFQISHKKPRVVSFMNKVGKYIHIQHVIKYKLILYFRLPIIRAVARRYLKNDRLDCMRRNR